ncbi:MAG: hypothetical protein DRR19_25465 [Candidatus Parabeggiatoa sp. nov. 1]|nr:MAG: hypothetical protein DRR19_25465 [Gammaproteobacteria bacterium]
MNTLSNFLTIGLLLIWSIGVQAYSTTTSQPYQCRDVAKIDENALVISVPSQQLLYVPSQDKLYDLAQVRRCDPRALHRFHKVAVLDTQTGEPTKLVEWNQNNQFNYAQWQLGIGAESRAVEEMVIYAKTLQKLAETIKADDPQQKVNLWPWHVPYSGISKQLLAWLAELEPKALVVLTAGSYRGLSTIGELSPTHFTSWEERYSFEINNRIFADSKQVPLTTLFGQRPLSFEVQWRGENLFKIDTRLEDMEQRLSLPLWFLPDSPLKSEITLTLQETNALKAPLQLIELNTQASQLTFKVRQEYIKPTVRYPDDAPVNWTTLCPIKEELAQTWINYLVNSARLVCPYLDRQNQVKLELIGDGIHVDTRQLLLSLDFTLDDSYTNPKDWRIAGALSHLQSNNQRVWKILASDLSVGQCSLTFEPISAEATLAFTSTPAKMSDEICQRLYKRGYQQEMRGLKPWPKGQPEKMGHSFEIKVKPNPRLLQTHLPQDSLWRKRHWLLNNKHKCQIKDNGYFDCESGNNISFLDLLGGQITLQGFNDTIQIDQRLANNQALLAIYCGDWPRLFPLSHRNIIKGTADNSYAVLDRHTKTTRRFTRIYDNEPLWSLTAQPVKADVIDGFDKKRGDRLLTHGIPVSPQQKPLCKKYSYYQLATADKAVGSECINAPPPKSDAVHINWVFVNTQGEWRGIWDYRARHLAKPLAKFLHDANQEMTFQIWFLDVNDAREIGLEEYSRTTVNSQTDNRKIFNRLIQPIQNMRAQQVPQVLSALAEKQRWQEGGRYLTILFAHRLSIADLEQQINRLSLQKPLVILSRRLPKRSQREAWAKQGIDFIRLTPSSYWYNELVERLKAWNTGD